MQAAAGVLVVQSQESGQSCHNALGPRHCITTMKRTVGSIPCGLFIFCSLPAGKSTCLEDYLQIQTLPMSMVPRPGDGVVVCFQVIPLRVQHQQGFLLWAILVILSVSDLIVTPVFLMSHIYLGIQWQLYLVLKIINLIIIYQISNKDVDQKRHLMCQRKH